MLCRAVTWSWYRTACVGAFIFAASCCLGCAPGDDAEAAASDSAEKRETDGEQTAGDDSSPAESDEGAVESDVDGTDDETEATPTSDSGVETDPSVPSEPSPSPSGVDGVMVPCEELAFAVTCDDPQASQGYYGCSDYFGDITGVKESCSTDPNVDVREDSPCGAYEFAVGSCVYFTEALSDRCYITHVGAESADLVAVGQAFWEIACAGTWLPAQ